MPATLASMLTLLSPFLKGVSAKVLGIGKEDDVGYVQCPDPGKPYTCGGTVVFELRREEIKGKMLETQTSSFPESYFTCL